MRPAHTFRDPDLGEWFRAERGWSSRRQALGRPIELWVSGEAAPDRACAEAALRSLARVSALQDEVDAAFNIYRTNLPKPIQERRLLITDILMHRPSHGMLLLEAGNEERLWRCDLVDGQITLLLFDR